MKDSIRKLNRQRIQKSKELLLKVFRGLFDTPSKGQLREQNSKSILIFRLDGKVGDTIAASCLIDPLTENGHQVTLLVNPQISFLKYSDNVRVLVLKKGVLNTLFFCLKYRNHYDVGVNTSHIMSPRVLFLLRFLNLGFRIGFGNSNYRIFDRNANFDINSDHVSLRYKKVLEILKCPHKELKYSLPIPQKEHNEALAFIKNLQKSHEKIVIINSFAGARLRSLSEDTTVEIIKGILKNNHQTCFISIGNHNDLPLAQKYLANHPELQSHWFISPRSDFYFNLALVQHSDLVISPDTAIVHACSALNKKLVAIYREDVSAEKNAQIWAPLHKEAKIIYSKSGGKYEQDINDVDTASVVDYALHSL